MRTTYKTLLTLLTSLALVLSTQSALATTAPPSSTTPAPAADATDVVAAARAISKAVARATQDASTQPARTTPTAAAAATGGNKPVHIIPPRTITRKSGSYVWSWTTPPLPSSLFTNGEATDPNGGPAPLMYIGENDSPSFSFTVTLPEPAIGPPRPKFKLVHDYFGNVMVVQVGNSGLMVGRFDVPRAQDMAGRVFPVTLNISGATITENIGDTTNADYPIALTQAWATVRGPEEWKDAKSNADCRAHPFWNGCRTGSNKLYPSDGATFSSKWLTDIEIDCDQPDGKCEKCASSCWDAPATPATRREAYQLTRKIATVVYEAGIQTKCKVNYQKYISDPKKYPVGLLTTQGMTNWDEWLAHCIGMEANDAYLGKDVSTTIDLFILLGTLLTSAIERGYSSLVTAELNESEFSMKVSRRFSNGLIGYAERNAAAFTKRNQNAQTRILRSINSEVGGAEYNGCFNSFTGDTLVLMADGTSKPIENVQLGDMVWASNPLTGDSSPRKVTDLIRHSGQHLMATVRFADGTEITATDQHPFWVTSRQSWVDAINLQAGDVVSEANGNRLAVTSRTLSRQNLTAYNLTVNGLHTYYTGQDHVLVHNASCKYITDFGQFGRRFGYTRKEVEDAAHDVKAEASELKGAKIKNPDVGIDPSTGYVYPKLPKGGFGEDSIGNIFDFLPEKKRR